MIASLSALVNQVLTLSKKNSLLIAAIRICLKMFRSICVCCTSSLLPKLSSCSKSFLPNIMYELATSAYGPKSWRSRTAFPDHTTSSKMSAEMMDLCTWTKASDPAASWAFFDVRKIVADQFFWQMVRHLEWSTACRQATLSLWDSSGNASKSYSAPVK